MKTKQGKKLKTKESWRVVWRGASNKLGQEGASVTGLTYGAMNFVKRYGPFEGESRRINH
jgi:hypothetical protein